MKMSGVPTRPELLALIEKSKKHVMTPAEIWDQRVSWVYGNISMSNSRVTREHVIATITETHGPRPSE